DVCSSDLAENRVQICLCERLAASLAAFKSEQVQNHYRLISDAEKRRYLAITQKPPLASVIDDYRRSWRNITLILRMTRSDPADRCRARRQRAQCSEYPNGCARSEPFPK